MAEYARFYKKFWHNARIRNLTEDARNLFIYLFTCPHSNMLGLFVISQLYILSDLQWDRKRLDKAFRELLDKGFLRHDPIVDVILIPSWFEHNGHKWNPNQSIRAKAELSEIPQTVLFQDFISLNQTLQPTLCRTLTERVTQMVPSTITPTPTPTIPPTIPILSGKPDDVSNIPYKEIIEDLNQKARTKYRLSTPKTLSLIRVRWNEGFRFPDFQAVHDKKIAEWQNTDMAKFIRPETLYGTKFEGYLNQQDMREIKNPHHKEQEAVKEQFKNKYGIE